MIVWHNHSTMSQQTTHLHAEGEHKHSHLPDETWLCWWNGREPMPAPDLPADTILLGPPIPKESA